MRALLSGICGLLLLGCQHLASGSVALDLLGQSNQCNINTPQLTLLESTSAAQQVLYAHRFSEPPAVPPPQPGELLLLVAMGQQSSAGYRIETTAKQAELRDGVLHLPVIFHPPEGIAASVVTSPCVIFRVAAQGVGKVVAGETGLSLDL